MELARLSIVFCLLSSIFCVSGHSCSHKVHSCTPPSNGGQQQQTGEDKSNELDKLRHATKHPKNDTSIRIGYRSGAYLWNNTHTTWQHSMYRANADRDLALCGIRRVLKYNDERLHPITKVNTVMLEFVPFLLEKGQINKDNIKNMMIYTLIAFCVVNNEDLLAKCISGGMLCFNSFERLDILQQDANYITFLFGLMKTMVPPTDLSYLYIRIQKLSHIDKLLDKYKQILFTFLLLYFSYQLFSLEGALYAHAYTLPINTQDKQTARLITCKINDHGYKGEFEANMNEVLKTKSTNTCYTVNKLFSKLFSCNLIGPRERVEKTHNEFLDSTLDETSLQEVCKLLSTLKSEWFSETNCNTLTGILLDIHDINTTESFDLDIVHKAFSTGFVYSLANRDKLPSKYELSIIIGSRIAIYPECLKQMFLQITNEQKQKYYEVQQLKNKLDSSLVVRGEQGRQTIHRKFNTLNMDGEKITTALGKLSNMAIEFERLYARLCDKHNATKIPVLNVSITQESTGSFSDFQDTTTRSYTRRYMRM